MYKNTFYTKTTTDMHNNGSGQCSYDKEKGPIKSNIWKAHPYLIKIYRAKRLNKTKGEKQEKKINVY
jgi:hypothetical protein